jgi:putative ABC transport system ATP-binding protein
MGETEVRALDGIRLTIGTGEFVAIMGPSGSGKSTLMNILGCLDRPSAGSYVLDGVDVATLDSDERAEIRNARIGFVFQNFNLLPRTSALENVELPLLYFGDALAASDRLQRARSALRRVGLEGREDHHPSQLSGGQQQRVAIARALIHEPRLVVCDEPTAALDHASGEAVMELLAAHAVRPGRTIIVVTHDTRVFEYADSIAHMDDGRITHVTRRDGSRAASSSDVRGLVLEESLR